MESHIREGMALFVAAGLAAAAHLVAAGLAAAAHLVAAGARPAATGN